MYVTRNFFRRRPANNLPEILVLLLVVIQAEIPPQIPVALHTEILYRFSPDFLLPRILEILIQKYFLGIPTGTFPEISHGFLFSTEHFRRLPMRFFR